MTSKKRKDLSLKDRVAVIEKYETVKSLRKVADEFGVSAQQIQRILKQKDEIRARYVSNNNPSRKRPIIGTPSLFGTPRKSPKVFRITKFHCILIWHP